jgi:Calcium-dependent channel, 7TM region, putative phosphate
LLTDRFSCIVVQIIQTFFVSAITGGVSAELANILNDPESLITLLANSLPAQSSYFIQIVLAQTFFLQSFEILRIYPLGVSLLRRFFGPRLTAKERRRKWGWLYSLDDPPEFSHAETFAQLILLYMVSFVYSPIAPITSIILCFCFVLLESGYRYQFMHNYPRGLDTGGRLWKHFIAFTLAGMVVAQLTLIGLLALKQSQFAGPALGPLLATTILFIMFINAKHGTVSEYLPTRDCILRDSENTAEGPMDMDFVKGAYLQPSLQNKAVQPEYEDESNADSALRRWTEESDRSIDVYSQ